MPASLCSRPKTPRSPAGTPDAGRYGYWLTHQLPTLVVERLCQQRVSIQEQKVTGGVLRISIRSNQQAPGLVPQCADVDTPLFGQAASHSEDIVLTIGQKLWKAMRPFLLGGVQFGHGLERPARGRDSV